MDQKTVFEEIGSYYEAEAVRCWELMAKGHLHHGYWDETNANGEVGAGSMRLTDLMIQWTPIGEQQRLIDFGSGPGLPSIALAQQKGCFVDGVDASQYHTDNANRNAAAAGLAERAKYTVQDAVSLPCADDTYDAGWFLESIFHMDRAEALREAHRVLKRGSTLLITDFTNLDHTSEEFLQLQSEALLADHIDPAEYPKLLEDAGFELVTLNDLTEDVIVRSAPKYRESFPSFRDEMLKITDEDYLPFIEQVADLFAANTGYVYVEARAV